MNWFWYAHSRGPEVRRAGALEAPSLEAALREVFRWSRPREGDRLQLGLQGFPPASFECVFHEGEAPMRWQLVNRELA